MAKLTTDFSPSILHPFYFNRTGLKEGILPFAKSLKGKLMDFGCGSKPYKNLFEVDEYIGVDYYNEGHPHENEQIDIFYDGKTIPLPNQYFDSVLSSEVFEHVFNLDEVLIEINRVMKDGGMLLITCPFVWNEHEVPNDYARYTRFALKEILGRRGFEIVSFKKSGTFVQALVQLWNLYWYNVYMKKKNRFFLIRWFFKLQFLLANITGKILNAILPFNDSLYLNNIVLAKKKNTV